MKRVGLVLVLMVLLVAVPAVAPAQGGGADFTRLVGVGDSLTAGFKDGALFEAGQSGSFFTLIAASAGTASSIPTVAYPGIPTPNAATGQGLLLQIPGTCQVGATVFATGQTTGRVNPLAPATDVAVPGQTIGDALTVKWDIDPGNPAATANTAEDFVLGFPYAFAAPPLNTPRTQIETAVGLQPTFVVFWLGSGDALGAALAATVNNDTLTSVASFNTSADLAANAIKATGASVVVANIPDVTVIPNLFSVPDLMELTGRSAAELELLLNVKQGSYVPLSVLPQIQAIAAGTRPPGLHKDEILTKKEVKKIRKNITKYNQKLRAVADANGWAFVDVNSALNNYDQNGLVIPGVGTITTAYLGGLFGLDGVHPSSTGHAVIATAFIQAINAKYGTTLAPPNVPAIAAADPEVCMAGSAKRLTLNDVVQYAQAATSTTSVLLHNRHQ